MQTFRDVSLGEFRLKCLNCQHEFIYVTGANLLQLGDRPDNVTCELCKRSDNIITVETPTRIELDPTKP